MRLTAVSDAGPNACPLWLSESESVEPWKNAIMAKKALTREAGTHTFKTEYVAELEKEMLEKINNLGIGPGGLGGSTTALAVNINTYQPTLQDCRLR